MKKFKLNLTSVICFLISFSLIFTTIINDGICAANGENNNENKILIASTTDIHGDMNRLFRASTQIKNYEEAYPNRLILDNGDIFQGGSVEAFVNLFAQQLSTMTGKQYKTEEEIKNLMAWIYKKIGYDAINLGNHEFNYLYSEMKEIYQYIQDKGPAILSANFYKEGTKESELLPWITRKYKINGKEFKVGVLGLGHMDAGKENPKENTKGYNIGNKDKDIIEDYNNFVEEEANGEVTLKNGKYRATEKVDFLVVSYHNGSPKAKDYEKEIKDKSSVLYLIKNTKGINLVNAGHDHENNIQKVKNKDGKEIYVMNGGAKNRDKLKASLAEAVVTIKEEKGKLAVGSIDCKNIALDGVECDKSLSESSEIREFQKYVKQVSDHVFGSISDKNWDMGCSEDDLKIKDFKEKSEIISEKVRRKNNDTTTLIAKAMLWSAKKNSKKNKDGNWVSAFCPWISMAQPGDITLKNICDLYNYDNSYYVVEFTGKELKQWMEKVAGYCSIDDGKYKWTTAYPDKFNIAIFYGVNYKLNISKPVGSRVEELVLSNTGEQVTDSTKINMVLDNYQYGFYGAYGQLFGNSFEESSWSSSEGMGAFNGLIKTQLAEYIKEHTPIKHDDSDYHWELCGLEKTGGNTNVNNNKNTDSNLKEKTNNNNNTTSNNSDSLNKSNPSKSNSNSKKQTNSSNGIPDNMGNNDNNNNSNSDNQGKADLPKANEGVAKVADARKIKTGVD